jgi:pimeloyl-ACP methyl ester carboxylesterase
MLESAVRRFLYYPTVLDRDAPLPPYAADARELFLEAADGLVVHALYWAPPPDRPAVLFLHGNAETVLEWALVRPELAPMDCGLLLVDYPGYGKSSGHPTEAGCCAASQAALDWLDGELGDPSRRVLLFGKSLGGGVATKLAAERRVLGVVLESTFRSIPAVVRRLVPVLPAGGLLRSERYDSIGRIGAIGAPLLVIHGDRDELIPLSEGVALYEAAAPPKELWVVPGAGHNDVAAVAGAAYGTRLRQWLDGVLAQP